MREQHQWEIFNLAQKLLSLVEGDRIDQEVLFDKVQPTAVRILMLLADEDPARQDILLEKFPFWFQRKGADDDEN